MRRDFFALFGSGGETDRLTGVSTERFLPQFDEYAREITADRLPKGAFFIALLAVAFWPLDWLVLGDTPFETAVLARFRLAIVGLCVGLVAVARLTPWVRRAPVLVASIASICGTFLATFILSPLGGLQTPFFHSFHFISAISIILLTRLRLRIVIAVSLSAAAFAGYFIRMPDYLDYSYIGSSMGQLAAGTALAIVLGHVAYRLVLTVFVQRMQTAEQQEQLEQLNATLEDRVADQTRDLRALTQRLETAVADERRFMAREVHDQLGQQLTSMRLALAYTDKHADDAPQTVKSGLNELGHLIGRTRATMRRIVARLRPEILEQLGFVEAARWALNDLASRMDVETALEAVPEDLAVSDERAEALFYILQEVLTNVIRHSDASSVLVRIERRDNELCLTVVDDGVGLPDEKPPPTSVGMIGIRERAESIGGAALWTKTSGEGGVTLRVTLSVDSEQSGGDL